MSGLQFAYVNVVLVVDPYTHPMKQLWEQFGMRYMKGTDKYFYYVYTFSSPTQYFKKKNEIRFFKFCNTLQNYFGLL